MIPDSFHFLRPAWLAAIVPAAIILAAATRSGARSSAWRRVVDAHLLRHLLVSEDRPGRRWPLWALGLGWLAASVAMAGPTWEQMPSPTWTSRQPTVVALDLSPAMNVADLAPSRLAHARHKLHDILDATKGGQVALVLYADDAFVASPLTDDGRVIAEMIPSLESGLMPGAGSRPARAIAEASALLDGAGVPNGNVVLLTATAGDDADELRRAAEALASHGRKLSIVGLGTTAGAPLADARGRLVKDREGQPLVSRLDATELASIATSGNGRFASATADDADVRALLSPALAETTAFDHTQTSAQADTWRDVGAWLLLIPLLLAPLAFRRGALAGLALAIALLGRTSDAHASTWSDLWSTRDQQAQHALAEGRPGDAATLFDDPAWKAAAQYQGGAFDQAIAGYEKLAGAESRYNLGNSLARAGQLERALEAYDQALAEKPDHADATFNRDLVKRVLEQQKREQEQKQKEQNEQNQQQADQQQQQQQQDSRSSKDQNRQSGQPQRDANGQSGQGGDADQKQQAENDHEPADAGSQADASQAQHGSAEKTGQDAEQAKSSGSPPNDGSESKQDEQARSDEPQDEAKSAQNEPRDGDQQTENSGKASASAGEEKPADQGASTAAADAAGEPRPAGDEARARQAHQARSGTGDDESASAPAPRPTPGDHPGEGDSLAQQVDQALEKQPEQRASASGSSGASRPRTSEEEQAREQKLRSVPDDPGGLLRARIRRHFAENALSQR